MGPAPRKLCEKLQAMGCVSESGFVWHWSHSSGWFFDYDTDPQGTWRPAFLQNDFTGATERAIQNSEIAWGNEKIVFPLTKNNCKVYVSAWFAHRHEIIDVQGPWFKYLERTMRK